MSHEGSDYPQDIEKAAKYVTTGPEQDWLQSEQTDPIPKQLDIFLKKRPRYREPKGSDIDKGKKLVDLRKRSYFAGSVAGLALLTGIIAVSASSTENSQGSNTSISEQLPRFDSVNNSEVETFFNGYSEQIIQRAQQNGTIRTEDGATASQNVYYTSEFTAASLINGGNPRYALNYIIDPSAANEDQKVISSGISTVVGKNYINGISFKHAQNQKGENYWTITVARRDPLSNLVTQTIYSNEPGFSQDINRGKPVNGQDPRQLYDYEQLVLTQDRLTSLTQNADDFFDSSVRKDPIIDLNLNARN